MIVTYLASRETTGWSLGRMNCDMLMDDADGIAGHGSGAEEESDDDEQHVLLPTHTEFMNSASINSGKPNLRVSGGTRSFVIARFTFRRHWHANRSIKRKSKQSLTD